MEEKVMVNDVLSGIKLDLIDYQNAISESENMKLRQIFQLVRNENESFQYELFRIAENKGYYMSAEKATEKEIEKVKKEFQG